MKKNLRLYSFTEPYIQSIKQYLMDEYGINAAHNQAAKYALSVTHGNALTPDALRLINHRKLLRGITTIKVSNLTKRQEENLQRVAKQFPALRDRSLIASAIVIATALAINAQKAPQTVQTHEPEQRDHH